MTVSDFNAAKALRDLATSILKNSVQLPTSSPLPVSFEVVKQQNSGKYVIDIGGKQLEAASAKELINGAKYWAQILQKDGITTLLNALKKPDVMQQSGSYSSLEPISLDKLTKLLTQKQEIMQSVTTQNAPSAQTPTNETQKQTIANESKTQTQEFKSAVLDSLNQKSEQSNPQTQTLKETLPLQSNQTKTEQTQQKATIQTNSEVKNQTEQKTDDKLNINTQTEPKLPSRLNTDEKLLKSDAKINVEPQRQTQVKPENETPKQNSTEQLKTVKQDEKQASATFVEPKLPSRLNTDEKLLKSDEQKSSHDTKTSSETSSKNIEKNSNIDIKNEVKSNTESFKKDAESTLTAKEEAILNQTHIESYDELKQLVKALGEMPLIFSQADFIAQDTLYAAFEAIFGLPDAVKEMLTEPSATQEDGMFMLADTENNQAENTQNNAQTQSATQKDDKTASVPKDTPLNRIKQMLLEEISNTNNKHDFMILTNVALALNRQVVSMIVEDEEKKRALMQFRKKNQGKEVQSVEFYSAFNALGPIAGQITLASNEIYMTLECEFENTMKFLKEKLNELKSFDASKVSIKQAKTKELFTLSSSLLDIAG